jgi:hypothetical protein
MVLPCPVRSDGPKNRLGAVTHCLYRDGHLSKRITTIEAPRFLQFEVVEQRLGIEGCLQTCAGSYRIEPRGPETDVILQTTYRAYLRPRPLWRRFETLLIHQLHTHILRGIEDAATHHARTLRATGRQTGDVR